MCRILLVEDDPAVRRVIASMLHLDGFDVLEAGDEEETESVVARTKGAVDLLVTDVVLPRAGCHRLVSRLAHKFPEMQVLYISGYSQETVGNYGVGRSALNFLQKPFTPEELTGKVREVLGAAGQSRAANA